MKNKTTVLSLIVLLGIALRIIRALEMNRYDVDCYLYFNMAVSWAKYGADYVYKFGGSKIPPLLPFLMSTGYTLGIQPEITGTVLGILLGSLIPLCMFYIVNIFFKRYDLALLAAFLGAIHPSLVRISVRCLRDSLYIPLVAIASVLAVAAIKNKSIFKWCMFAVVAGLASLARYEGQELIIIFMIWFVVEIVVNRKNIKENFKNYCYSFLLVVIIFFTLNFCGSYLLQSELLSFYSIIKSGILPK